MRNSLRCEMPMSNDDMDEWMSRIGAYSMVEATVVGASEGGAALLSDLKMFTERDLELSMISDELQAPVLIEAPLFGTLTLDRRVDHFQGAAQWCGSPVRLSITCKDVTNTTAAVAMAESLFASQVDWDERVKLYAADQLLQLKNESWLEDGQKDISRDDFVSRITLEEISVDEGGDIGFWHNDGDLFWGHMILVRGNIEAGLLDAGIHG